MEINILDFSNSSRRRDKFHIIAQILELSTNGILKTQIMYKANLSFAQLNGYMKLMLKTGLLDSYSRDGKEFYKTTEKGLNFLRLYRRMTGLLKS